MEPQDVRETAGSSDSQGALGRKAPRVTRDWRANLERGGWLDCLGRWDLLDRPDHPVLRVPPAVLAGAVREGILSPVRQDSRVHPDLRVLLVSVVCLGGLGSQVYLEIKVLRGPEVVMGFLASTVHQADWAIRERVEKEEKGVSQGEREGPLDPPAPPGPRDRSSTSRQVTEELVTQGDQDSRGRSDPRETPDSQGSQERRPRETRESQGSSEIGTGTPSTWEGCLEPRGFRDTLALWDHQVRMVLLVQRGTSGFLADRVDLDSMEPKDRRATLRLVLAQDTRAPQGHRGPLVNREAAAPRPDSVVMTTPQDIITLQRETRVIVGSLESLGCQV
ncbi:unnamed protein product [Arctogadus glacialis]